MEQFNFDPTIEYDVVELPSRGIHYTNNKKSVKVAYLTAADENILTSPNVNKGFNIVNELLKRKILDKDINVEELVEEDKQAILVMLRNTSFGPMYNITTTDPKTNQQFSIEVDISELNFKKFNLTADENGEYQYAMQKSGVNITFKFLNKKQEDELIKFDKEYSGPGATPIRTKELEMMIKSINGNREPMIIYTFINDKLPIKDSQDFRKFVNENKPGLDLKKKITTPSGEEIDVYIDLGLEFFRPFFGL